MTQTPIARSQPDDILIVGGGIAGSLLALVAGRAGYAVTVVDPKRDPAPVFRNEKLGVAQSLLLSKLDALQCFEQALWPAEDDPHAYPAGQTPGLTDCGAPHQAWLASVRRAWPSSVRFVESTVETLDVSNDVQRAVTAQGEPLAARLAVLATGRMPGLRQSLGVECLILSAGHSVCLGFSVAFDDPVPAQVVDAPAGSGVGYVSLFPMPGETRINVFSYRPLADPWTRRMSADPIGCIAALDPRLARLLDGARLLRRCEARGTDLYEVSGHRQAGLILIGDAFHAPCPASGTGMLRILNDIDVLTRSHLPRWFETDGMDSTKIAAFYDDPEKRRLDDESIRSSLRGRNSVVGTSPYWRGRRLIGTLRRALRSRIAA
jgi:2-polyprenyl-6-methoxyphenol hydroxylase-like FAD-dependent oxidoreductase